MYPIICRVKIVCELEFLFVEIFLVGRHKESRFSEHVQRLTLFQQIYNIQLYKVGVIFVVAPVLNGF